jgi:hypothetical protein
VSPAIGQAFNGGGLIVEIGPSTITIDDPGPPPEKVTLTVTPSSQLLFRSSALPNSAEAPTTIHQLGVGDPVKFTAVRSSATAYTLLELHAGPAADASTPALKQAAADQAPTPPPVGGSFKAEGTVTAYSPGSVTINVASGNLTGTVTFTLHCAPALPVVGHTFDIAGIRIGGDSYDATVFAPAVP